VTSQKAIEPEAKKQDYWGREGWQNICLTCIDKKGTMRHSLLPKAM
jgi:hypothetical protein